MTVLDDRRKKVPFDARYFEKLKATGINLSIADKFRRIYERNHWAADESVSGEGSESGQTETLKTVLPVLLKELEVEVLLDLPCGDFAWMKDIDLPVSAYTGGDIVPELIAENQRRYSKKDLRFEIMDLTSDPLPAADLILCRDCLVHLSFADINKAIENIKRSSIPYLLTTTFPELEENEDINTGDWRLLNLERPPFKFPPPLRMINEQCTEAGGHFRDKSLGLWQTGDI